MEKLKTTLKNIGIAFIGIPIFIIVLIAGLFVDEVIVYEKLKFNKNEIIGIIMALIIYCIIIITIVLVK